MAINLWKSGGQPLSYSPLPTGSVNQVTLPIGSYIVRFKAKSPTSVLMRFVNNGAMMIDQYCNLTPVFQSFEIPFTFTRSELARFYDNANKGDIIIDSIELVQKPLPKFTINGIDGFSSGKWVLNANAKVLDDETCELNATGVGQASYLRINVLQNTNYTIQCTTDIEFAIYDDIPNLQILPYNGISPRTFNSGNNSVIRLYLKNNVIATGKFTFKRPMLNQGSVAAPYSKKTGDKMVLPVAKKNLYYGQWDRYATGTSRTSLNIPCKGNVTYTLSGGNRATWYCFNSVATRTTISGATITTPVDTVYFKVLFLEETGYQGNPDTAPIQIEEGTTATVYTPYAVQVNPKPKRYVAKKNLFDGVLESGSIDLTTGANAGSSTLSRSLNYVPVKGSMSYTFSRLRYVLFYDINKNFISYSGSTTDDVKTFPTPSNCAFMRFLITTTDLTTKVQLEEGTTATAYEPFTQVLPRAKTGLAFNGTTDYFQLPSMAMDSIEIDCLIDSVQLDTNTVLIDARPGFNGFLAKNEGLSGFSRFYVNNNLGVDYNSIPKNQRTKVKVVNDVPFTDNVNIFSNVTAIRNAKGILYKVTCYLAGQEVARYNFENTNNLVGNQMLQNAKNLIPSFEDARWSLYANAKVLGKDILRFDATATGQWSGIVIPVTVGKTYTLTTGGSETLYVRKGDNITGGSLIGGVLNSLLTFTVDATYNGYILIYYTSTAIKSYDFIKPQLYALDGTEGTLVGTPVSLLKTAKANRYAKR